MDNKVVADVVGGKDSLDSVRKTLVFLLEKTKFNKQMVFSCITFFAEAVSASAKTSSNRHETSMWSAQNSSIPNLKHSIMLLCEAINQSKQSVTPDADTAASLEHGPGVVDI